MGIVLGVVVFIATVLWCGLILFANGMSDAPTVQYTVWPWFVGGSAVSGLLIMSHWWGW